MFKSKKRIFSLLLALVLVLGLSVSAFAEMEILPDDGVLEVKAIDGSNEYSVEMKFVEVNGVTRYTGYIEFPSNSVDLSDVQIEAEFDDLEYSLEVNGVPYTSNMSVNFSDGYVDFVLKSGSTIFRTYQINAGIKGTNTPIIVAIDLKNANDWIDGRYKSKNKEGYVVPLAEDYPLAKDRVQNAVDGLENGQLSVIVLADIGESAMDVFKRAIGARYLNLNAIGADSGYVSEIGRNGHETLPALLFQETHPEDFPPEEWWKDRTGWIYKMNDEVPNMGASQYIITASDETMIWGYTFDWGIDLGGPEW
ncbi:hypothetical protein [Tepidimicrobium xylanilyticum]|uniref:hypothetical protein n=1 Tax=Tepidimicrobium xylanilyticum TaxID=1123352 RepID=UPI00264E8519|nr:hypothetical protein [Tepidimicrobium xylanilyticum]GMG95188.1 hypothetical protein EN5CB1_00140 [Tepidimicrobium xylanilyticum]